VAVVIRHDVDDAEFRVPGGGVTANGPDDADDGAHTVFGDGFRAS
jgi:hypothetical protein